MIELKSDILRQIQMIQLEMLVEVDRICKKCDIHYNIIAGTLLGAVRHGGYIPWDDDADIAFLRSEYEKFRRACKTELLREYQEYMPYKQGVFIDIFPLDGVPDKYILRSMHNFECFCVRKILWSEVGKLAESNFIKRKIYGWLAKIPVERVFNYYEKLIWRSNRMAGRMVRILMFPTPNNEYGYYRCGIRTASH